MKLILALLMAFALYGQIPQLPPVSGGGLSTPDGSPAAGTYVGTQSITLTATGASYILYTTNGSTPACPATGTTYTVPITVSVITTVKAIGCGASSVAILLYTITSGTLSWASLTNGQWTGLTNGQWTALTN